MWRGVPGRRCRLPQPASGPPLASVPRAAALRLACPSAPRSASPCRCAISVARPHQWGRAADWRIRRRRTESPCRAPSCPVGGAADGDGCGCLCPAPAWLHCPNRTCLVAVLRPRLPCSACDATIGGVGVLSDQRCRPFWSPGSCSCPDRVSRGHGPVDVGVVHANDRRRPRPRLPCRARGTATGDGVPCSCCPSRTCRVPRIHVRCRTSRRSRIPCARRTCPCGRPPSVLVPLRCSRRRHRSRAVRTCAVRCRRSRRHRPDVVRRVRASMGVSRTLVRHASAPESAGSSAIGVPCRRHRPCLVLSAARCHRLGRTRRGRRTRCSRAEPRRIGTAVADRGPAPSPWSGVRAPVSGGRIPCGCASSGAQPARHRRPPRFHRTPRAREAGIPPTSRRLPRAPRREPTNRATLRPRFLATRSWSRSCRPCPSPSPSLPKWSWPPAPVPMPSRLEPGAGCSRTRCGPTVLRCPWWTRL